MDSFLFYQCEVLKKTSITLLLIKLD